MNTEESHSPSHDEPAPDSAVLAALRRLPGERGSAGPVTDEAVLTMARPRLAEIRRQHQLRRFWRGVAAAAAVVAAGLFVLSRGLSGPGADPAPMAKGPDVSEAVVILREVSALFPNQIQAITRDDAGIRLTLTDQPRTTAGPGVLIEVQHAGKVVQIITFGGQTIDLMGRMVMVEADREGHIRIKGRDIEWLSSQPAKVPGDLHIKATVI